MQRVDRSKKFKVVFKRSGNSSREGASKGSEFILARGLTLPAARQYAEAVRMRDGRAVIVEESPEDCGPGSPLRLPGSWSEVVRCPECGLKQAKAPTCQRCGHRY